MGWRAAGRRMVGLMSDQVARIPSASDLPERVRGKLDELASQFDAIERDLQDPEVVTNHRRVRDLSIRKAAIAPVVEGWRRYGALRREMAEMREAIEDAADPELVELAREEIPRLEREASEVVASVKSALVTSDDRAVGSVMLEIRAGAGGDEAGLWARDLLSMYERYAHGRGWSWETLDLSADAGVGGVRHAVVNIKGEGVWSELAFEAGVHSVKRVPATESQGRIHTSTATVAVLPEPEAVEVSIDWDEVDEHVTTAQGPGGQNVNKVATAVVLRHRPTGIEVRMQESKSQQQNREKARRLLLTRLYDLERRRAHEARSAARSAQIGGGERSEKIRVYRYQEGMVVDQRLDTKYPLQHTLAGGLGPVVEALLEQETARRLAAL